jgi:hypothetical protein
MTKKGKATAVKVKGGFSFKGSDGEGKVWKPRKKPSKKSESIYYSVSP